MVGEGPEDAVIASIWAGGSKRRYLTVRLGEVDHAVSEPIVWFPFLLLVVLGWIGLVVILPSELASGFIDITFGWMGLFSGEISFTVLVSLVTDVVGLVIAFIVYARVYGAVISWFLDRSG